ncbi:hypothetical protein D9M69_537010 [compost metagenome]
MTPLHRLSFAPLVKYQTPESIHDQNGFAPGSTGAPASGRARAADVLMHEGSRPSSQTTKQIGDAAEDKVAKYLVRSGHEIMERNWKTKFCEIDIVSKYGDTVYFTEVKYRKKPDQGGGLAAITNKKQRQMTFAAEYYAVKYSLKSFSLRLAAASVTGQPPEVEEFLELG